MIASGSADDAVVIGPAGLGVNTATPAAALDVNGDLLIRGDLALASSRALKQGVRPLEAEEARAALMELTPVHFSYKASPDRPQLGFVAEEVPDLVASQDHKSLSPMDFVALMTRTAQARQLQLEEQRKIVADHAARIEALEAGVARLGPPGRAGARLDY